MGVEHIFTCDHCNKRRFTALDDAYCVDDEKHPFNWKVITTWAYHRSEFQPDKKIFCSMQCVSGFSSNQIKAGAFNEHHENKI